MSFEDSLMVALFGIVVVFSVLILLSLLIKIQSMILGYITAFQDKSGAVTEAETAFASIVSEEAVDEGWSAGELKLLGVDEKTAAMIMAIVSDESQIPLSQLQFKMIKAID